MVVLMMMMVVIRSNAITCCYLSHKIRFEAPNRE
jgi:hypothetical protein